MPDGNTIGNISVANGFGWVVRIGRVDGVGPHEHLDGLDHLSIPHVVGVEVLQAEVRPTYIEHVFCSLSSR
jgi:hypothetical protein